MTTIKATTLEGTKTNLDEAELEQLRKNLKGRLILPDDGKYETARMVWNGNIDRKPAMIAQCMGVADVIDSVKFAASNNLLVAIRGGAHSAAGYGTCDGGIVIDLSGMKGIRVDPSSKTIRAQAGVQWGDIDREAGAFGLATTGGLISNTGVAGLTLGGGLGWLMGKHGLTIDNLLSADVVTADGRYLTASADENADLFWGLRGGGGNFGIVTSFEYRLHKIEPLFLSGLVIHPLDKAKEVMRFYRDFSSNIPDELEAYAGLLTAPEGFPAIALILGYNGPLDEGEKALKPAREFGEPLADIVQPMPHSVRNTMLDDPAAIHGIQRYWKSGFTDIITDDFIDEMIAGASNLISPLTGITFFRIHGAAARVPASETAFGMRGEKWDFNLVSQWHDASESDQQIAWTRELWSKLEPHISGSAYVNHIAGDDRPEKVRASFGPNYDKLVALKKKYDPKNLFRINPNIQP